MLSTIGAALLDAVPFLAGAGSTVLTSAGSAITLALSFLGGWKVRAAAVILAALAFGAFYLVDEAKDARREARLAEAIAEFRKQEGEVKAANERLESARQSIARAAHDLGACQLANADEIKVTERVRADGQARAEMLAIELANAGQRLRRALETRERINASATQCPRPDQLHPAVGAFLDGVQQRAGRR